MPAASPITTSIDFERDGKQVGHLRLPYSSNISAYGWIGIPIAVVRNGSGPTVLLTAGIHGDEYEGQITLASLIRRLDPADIRGRIIIVPTVNAPAAQAGQRCSPIDDLNLNRCFPGNPNGRPTEVIAHYVESVLVPMADGAADLHSGGKTLDYIPSALVRHHDDPAVLARRRELLEAFGAPIGYIVSAIHGEGTYMAALERQGVLGVGTELGGAGTVTRQTLSVAETGVWNMLELFGFIPPRGPHIDRGHRTRLTRVPDPSYYLYSPCRGLMEPLFELGEDVRAGQLAARIHDMASPDRPPVEVHWEASGHVICRRPILQVDLGDCLGHLAIDIEG